MQSLDEKKFARIDETCLCIVVVLSQDALRLPDVARRDGVRETSRMGLLHG